MSRGKQKWRRRQEKLRQAAAALDQQTPASAGEGAPSNLRPSEELGMVGRAIREEWPVTDAVKSETIATVQRIMAKAEEAYPETALAAADKLLRMTAQNIAARKLAYGDPTPTASMPAEPVSATVTHEHHHEHSHQHTFAVEQRAATLIEIIDCELAARDDAGESREPAGDGRPADAIDAVPEAEAVPEPELRGSPVRWGGWRREE